MIEVRKWSAAGLVDDSVNISCIHQDCVIVVSTLKVDNVGWQIFETFVELGMASNFNLECFWITPKCVASGEWDTTKELSFVQVCLWLSRATSC